MGEVYRAHDTKLGRDVAIKILPSNHAADPDRSARFEREARLLASLSHPNIGVIYGFEDTTASHALVLELVEGETLDERVRRGALSVRETLDIARQIAAALDAAHQKGIIHRDLKPANVKITPAGVVKVLDFGLAKLVEDGRSDAAQSTVTLGSTRGGVIVGTPAYMSPEQARAQPLDERADVWSFGCVLYEMVTGRPPFSGATVVDTISAILSSEPDWGVLPGRTPPSIRRLLERCLEKAPASRLRHIGAVARDLEEALAEDGRRSERPSADAAVRPTKTSRGRPALKAAAFAALALLLATGYMWLGRSSRPFDSIAILPFVNASGNPEVEYLSDGITESLINTVSQVPGLAVMSRNSVFRFKGKATNAQAAGQSLNVETVLTGLVVPRGESLSISVELIDVRNDRHIWGEQWNRKIGDLLAVQDEISTEISEKLRLKLTGEERQHLVKRYTQNTDAYRLYLQGRYHWNKRTPTGFNKAIDYFRQAIELDSSYAPAYAGMAETYINLGNYNFALLPPMEAWPQARAAANKAIALDDSVAAAHAAVALCAYQWEWDWTAAEREFKRALALDPTSSSTHHWYAHYLMTMGRTEESLREGRRALELDPLDLPSNAHEGWYHLFIRQPDRALGPLRRTIEMDANFSVAQWYLGWAYEQLGARREAIVQFERTVRLTQRKPSMLALLGHALAAANRRDEALAILRELNDRAKDQYVAAYPVAAIHAALGEPDAAFSWLNKAYDERDSWLDYVALDPRLDGLRSDARFTGLLRRLKLTQ
jgi:serine/threonine-protein kinase